MDVIEKGDEIKFDNQCYSRTQLLKWLNLNANNTLPHNRGVISNEDFKKRDFRGGLNKSKKSRSKKSRK